MEETKEDPEPPYCANLCDATTNNPISVYGSTTATLVHDPFTNNQTKKDTKQSNLNDKTVDEVLQCRALQKFLGDKEQVDHFKNNPVYRETTLKGFCGYTSYKPKGTTSGGTRGGTCGKKRRNTKKQRNTKKRRNMKKRK
jgi:hypothetical protein